MYFCIFEPVTHVLLSMFSETKLARFINACTSTENLSALNKRTCNSGDATPVLCANKERKQAKTVQQL